MPASDAVAAVAVSRAEVRKSLNRLEHHLGRGVKGARGVRREVAYLDALHRQTVRMSGIATGQSYVSAPSSFGARAAAAINSGNTRTIGKVKSSVLADFSADGLTPARDFTYSEGFRILGVEWVWQANASACPTCLAKHGNRYQGPFIPSHPSCLCIPLTLKQAETGKVQPLSPDQVGDAIQSYGDPRYYDIADELKKGTIDLRTAGQVENVNGHSRGYDAWRRHRELEEVTPTAGAPKVPTTLEAVVEPAAPLTAIEVEALKVAEAATRPLSELADDTLGKLSNSATKKAQEAVREAISIAEDHIASLPPAARQEFYNALEYISSLRLEALKSVPKGGKVVHGHWASRSRIPRRGIVERELMIQTKRVDYDAWNEYVKRNNHWVRDNNDAFAKGGIDAAREHAAKFPRPVEPTVIVDATADEIASTLIHELTHIIDELNEHLPRKQVSAMYDLVAKEYANGVEEFWYAASKSTLGQPMYGETVAELSRFYIQGWPGKLTAEQWRAKYPDMARFVEEVIYGG